MKAGTLTPHAVGKVALTVSGVKSNSFDDSFEFVGTSQLSRYRLGELTRKIPPQKAARLMKPVPGRPPTDALFGFFDLHKAMDPGDPTTPISQVTRALVVFEYSDVSSWIVRFGVQGRKNRFRSRAFLIGGTDSLRDWFAD